MKQSLKLVKGFRKIAETINDNKKQFILRGLIDGLKESKANKDKEESEILNNFLNICAM